MASDAAPNADSGLLPRTYFKAPRVPLDLRALFLALVAYVTYRLGVWLLGKIWDPVDPVATFWSEVRNALPSDLFPGLALGGHAGGAVGNVWQAIAGGLWVFTVFGFFGQAIHRITALRIARDEGMSLKDSVGFARKNFTTILWCPLIVAAFVAVLLGCNAAAGAVIAFDYVGSILSIVLVPLAMISSFLALLILIGAAVGLPLVAAAAAWERNGSLDALSRAFSYVFARPLQFFWNYFLIFIFVSVIGFAGRSFERLLENSIDWGLWRDTPSMLVNTPEGEGAAKKFENYSKETQELFIDIMKKERDGNEGREMPRPLAVSFTAVKSAPVGHMLTILVFWVLLNLVRFGVAATAIWWFLGATTSTYADLRCDVDGTEEDEIYLEEEEEDFDALATPPTASPPSPAAGAPPPASPSAS